METRHLTLPVGVSHADASLGARLVRLLVEAPGYAGDIADALGLSPIVVSRELEQLASEGVIQACAGEDGTWYRYRPRRADDADAPLESALVARR
ncbi:winged helix-turn-helix domain-containing protein [Microbacterium sp. X-17]|uniref:winged helix-turn-helix domain-containing protein n=1 Tax=Microbacterium sp. X-17 TaxID=3144404 RepID=UPI0031F48D2E